MNLVNLDNLWSFHTVPNSYSNTIMKVYTSIKYHYMMKWWDMKEIQIGWLPKFRQIYGITVSSHGISIHSDSSSMPRKYAFIYHAID